MWLIISVTPSLDLCGSERKLSLAFCINGVVNHTCVSSEVVNRMGNVIINHSMVCLLHYCRINFDLL